VDRLSPPSLVVRPVGATPLYLRHLGGTRALAVCAPT